MSPIPQIAAIDSTLALRADPYRFISKHCREFGSDVFRTRIMLRQAVCMQGAEAAAVFYDNERFMRMGAAPEPVRATLLGKGGVQNLDAEAHRHRKRMFMSMMSASHVDELVRLTREHWLAFAARWQHQRSVALYEEVQELLARAVCTWAGVPLHESEAIRRARELSALFDQAAGPRHLHSRLSRKRAERWIASIITDIRAGRTDVPPGSAAYVVATHRDLDGKLLTPAICAVELLNVLRPTVAISVFVVFVAHALHTHRDVRLRVLARETGFLDHFVQEVRRYYPFFPAAMARVCRDFEWRGYRFETGTRTMLDLYGTNHDPRVWEAPEEFRPDRFVTGRYTPFSFVPQGGGDHYVNHRCAGEAITIELMKVSTEILACDLEWDVPEQELEIDFARLPALPKSHFVMSNVRLRSAR